LSTIHADKASSIPNRMYSLLETNQDIEQFLKSIYRYIQIGVYIRGYQDKATKKFVREIAEVTEFYVTKDNEAVYNEIYKKSTTGKVVRRKPSQYLIDYLDAQGVTLDPNMIQEGESGAPKNFDDFLKKPGVIIEPSVEDVLKETPVQEKVTTPLFNSTNVQKAVEPEVKPVQQPQQTVKPAFTFDENGTPIFNRSTSTERANVGISRGGVIFDANSTNSNL